MAYQALYRKWRPETFVQMVGQEHIKKTLENQIMSGHIAHAYLFCGSRGTGKTSTAKILARAINCEHPVNGDSCGKCTTCIALKGNTDLDILEIDAASNNGVDEIRDLREKIKYPPQYGRYKVYIIDEVHMLSLSAFNALLKTLEEPPEHAVFILATTEPQKLPATILSRCQRFDFGRFTASQLVGRLQEAANAAGVTYTDDAILSIARAAEGGMRDALSILDICISYSNHVDDTVVRSVLGTADKSFMFAFSSALKEGRISDVMQLIHRLIRDGKEPQVFLRDLSRHLRALLLAQTTGNALKELLEITDDDAQQYVIASTGFSTEKLIRMLDIFADSEGNMRYAASPRLALEIACVKACVKMQNADVSGLNERLTVLENQIIKGNVLQTDENKKKTLPTAKTVTSVTKQTIVPQSALWDEVLKEVKKKSPGLFSFLKNASYAGRFGNVHRCVIKKEEAFKLEHLNKPVNRNQLCEIIMHLSGTESLFEAVFAEENADENSKEQMAIEQLSETFGRDTVQVKD